MSPWYTPRVDPYRDQAESYALGSLGGQELDAFEHHLRAGCPACHAEVDAHRDALRRLSPTVAPDPRLRQQVLDLSEAPSLPLDLAGFAWEEPYPDFKIALVKEDPSRGLRACLLWAKPGARYPAHRHGGQENVLILQGAYKDEERCYGPGEIARRQPGSVHSIEIVAGEDCISYLVSYGDIEVVGTL